MVIYRSSCQNQLKSLWQNTHRNGGALLPPQIYRCQLVFFGKECDMHLINEATANRALYIPVEMTQRYYDLKKFIRHTTK